KVIWNMRNEAVEGAGDKYITKDDVATVISEWAKTNFEVQIDAYDLRGMHHIDELEPYIKEQAKAEALTTITATLDELMGEDEGDEEDGQPGTQSWDVKGLSSWAMSRFHVNLPVTQIKKMSKDEVEDRVRETAVE